MIKVELTGRRFGRLLVLGRDGQNSRGVYFWRCQCDCGQTTRVTTGAINKPLGTRSCGCLRVDAVADAHRTHGMKGTPEWRSWRAMKTRCLNANGRGFKDYGGRGIKICERWINSFENFYADMGPRPEGTTLDRIDVNGHYEPTNCRWATDAEQTNNQRTNRQITFAGRTQTLAQWATAIGFSPVALSDRLKSGWSIERAMTTPPRADRRRANGRGEPNNPA